MSTWNSRGLRGSVLEELINRTNEIYRNENLALVQKIPTPITPTEYDRETGRISVAYFEKKSTVDYLGVVQGIPICFDAKECKTDTFPLSNIHPHQLAFMEAFEAQKGIAFLIVYFSKREIFYYMTLRELLTFIERAQEGGIKRIKFSELDENYIIPCDSSMRVLYLEGIQRDLNSRED